MKDSKLFKSLVATFVIIVLGGPAVVLADIHSYMADTHSYFEDPKVTVSYADLNLESEEGVRVLYRRLQHASTEVCSTRSLNNALSIFVGYETRACYRRTLSNAVDRFDNEDLTRVHAG